MKDEYVLYLDESEFKNSKTFTIAGIAIKKENVELLEKGLMEIKKLIWSEEYIASSNPILHCTELERVFSNRNSEEVSDVKAEYQKFVKLNSEDVKKIYDQIYGKMAQILRKSNATVFSCVIKLQQLYDLYFLDAAHNGIHLIDDKYNIALQKIIENFYALFSGK